MTIALLMLVGVSIIKEKKWVNPVSVMLVLWAIIIQFSRLGLYELYSTDTKYYVFIFIGLVSFFIGYILVKNKNYYLDAEISNRSINYEFCYLALIVCILITVLKLKDYGFDFSNIQLFGEFSHEYKSKFVNMLFEFVAYPLYNTFVCITIADIFFGKKDKLLLALTAVMIFMWMLVSGGRIAIIRLFIVIIVCMSLSINAKSKLKKFFANIKFAAVFVFLCAIFAYFTLLKGFDVLFNVYSDFAIQPKMFEYWSQKITDSYAFGSASMFGFIYPILYLVKNALGLAELPFGSQIVYENIQQTFNSWIVLGTYYRCNAYTSSFWYLYYDGRIIGIIIGMLIWGMMSKKVFDKAVKRGDIKSISIYSLFMIGIIYTFTDMEFSKANYVLAFIYISKICFNKYKLVFGSKWRKI